MCLINENGTSCSNYTCISVSTFRLYSNQNAQTTRIYQMLPMASTFINNNEMYWIFGCYIHGGGFSTGSKEKMRSELTQLLAAGISVASKINYRYKTIVFGAHNDAKKALQFIRSQAESWG